MHPPIAPFYIPRKWENVAAGLSGGAAYALFLFLGDPGRGTVAGAFFGALVACIRICWPLRREVWYNVIMAVLIVFHVVAAFYFNWSMAAQWTGFLFMPFMAADIILILGMVYIMYRLLYGPPRDLFVQTDINYSVNDVDIS
jgi:hypothetical protein